MNSNNTLFTGLIPQNYDEYLGPMFFEPYAQDIVARIKNPVNRVLELACGTGRVTVHLRKQLAPATKIVASDLNPDMISVATSRVTDPLIEWVVADMQELPFPDESFECIVCQFGIMFVPDKIRVFKEVCRVLKNGGMFLFNTWDKIENNGVAWIANKAVTKFFNGAPPAFFAVPFSLHSPEDLKELATRNGFSSISIELVKKEGRSVSAADATKGILEGNPIIKEINDKGMGSLDVVGNLVFEELASTYGVSPMISPLQAWVCVAIK